MSQSEAVQANLSSQPVESVLVGSLPASRAGSRAGSAAASRPGFDQAWQEHVRWDGNFRPLNNAAYEQLPEARKLRELVKRSLVVPAWLANIESPQWALYYNNMRRLRERALALSTAAAQRVYTKDDSDEDLSFDIHESLPSILHLPYHCLSLQLHGSVFNPAEADRRHPMDTLGSLVWDLQSDGLVIYRTERKLEIPHIPEQAGQTRQENIGDVQPDAGAFIVLPPSIELLPLNSWRALSCLPSTGSSGASNHCYALHWVTEFKCDGNETTSKCQVAKGLVSALYQRRAFGCPNHFVFGTAHHSRTTLEVLAATWVPDEHAEPETRLLDATKNAVPAEGQENGSSGKLSRDDNTASEAPKTGEDAADVPTNLTTKEIKKYNKIVVYSIATYNLRATEGVLELYLLMRQTRALAQQYKNEITKDALGRIAGLLNEENEIYQWPPLPRPKPASDHDPKRRKYTSSLSHTLDKDCMSIDPDEDFDSQSDSEELESLSSGGPTDRIVGEVASYTLMNYAHDEDAGACVPDYPYVAQTSVDQTA
ncbi:hypothetical protein V565_034280 [Rhizoctonia solani 123E]|uniref:Uncharacterized protein n=1 Tax=Rhizoctonia solani 123E TaxID=1423351 RepID=A0A074S8G1_9AGAM|nr:hypothetical protein V565_034280 [Rhizoctonia solani 123E]